MTMGTLAKRAQQLAPISKRFKDTPLAEVDRLASEYILGMVPRVLFEPAWLRVRRPVSANLLGITTLNLPLGVPPEAAELIVRINAKAEYNRVGDVVRAAIRQALKDTGIT